MNIIVYILIIIYSFAIFFRISDFYKISYKYNFTLYASRLLFFGGFLHSLVFFGRTLQLNRFPLLTLFDVLFFFSLVLVLFTILLRYVFNWRLFENITIFLGLFILIGASSVGDSHPEISDDLLSRLAFIHILLTLISYCIFSLSAIFSLLYITNDSLLKQKIWNKFTASLPSLESLDRNTYISNIIASILLFIGLVFGLIWASLFYNWTLFFDPKVLMSIIVLILYVIAIIKRQKRSWNNKQLAIWNIFSFVMIILNFVVAYLLDSFHSWI